LPLKWRLTASSRTTLVDMKSESRPQGTSKEGFRILSPEIIELISKAVEEGEKVFLFGARKGLAPTTLCGDCGSILSCKNCGAPVVLHSNSNRNRQVDEPVINAPVIGSRVYICHACRARRPAETKCDTCGSWKLSSLGIGIDRIADEVSEIFPGVRISILDKDHTPTPVQAKRVIKNFKDHGQILIGTELAFLHLEKVAYVGLVSVDALFSIPDFSINERIFYLVSRLREMSDKEAIIQTRNIGKSILAWASTGNILEFYKSEIKDREEVAYPPISLFIKVTLPLKSRDILEKKEEVTRIFSDWRPEFVSDKTSTSMIIRLPRNKWPDRVLVTQLSLLSPDFLIKVDPESIL
jgi:primosomal protein N' (replication factor Y) (superfamily II helicase)